MPELTEETERDAWAIEKILSSWIDECRECADLDEALWADAEVAGTVLMSAMHTALGMARTVDQIRASNRERRT